MSLFGDLPRSRLNTFRHQTGCTIISSRLAAQKCAFENLQQPVHEDIPKNKSGYTYATPCSDYFKCVMSGSEELSSNISRVQL